MKTNFYVFFGIVAESHFDFSWYAEVVSSSSCYPCPFFYLSLWCRSFSSFESYLYLRPRSISRPDSSYSNCWWYSPWFCGWLRCQVYSWLNILELTSLAYWQFSQQPRYLDFKTSKTNHFCGQCNSPLYALKTFS